MIKLTKNVLDCLFKYGFPKKGVYSKIMLRERSIIRVEWGVLDEIADVILRYANLKMMIPKEVNIINLYAWNPFHILYIPDNK